MSLARFRQFLAVLAVSARAFAADLTVNDPGDAGGLCGTTCTLRQAMAIAAPGDRIVFAIPGCATVCKITPATPLPQLTKGRVTIDGTTQTKKNPNGPDILVEGGHGTATNGFDIRSGGNTIRGLIVNRFPGAGILVAIGGVGGIEGPPPGGGANSILDSYIGTDPAGTVKAPNGDGVRVLPNASFTSISGNLISGNTQAGVRLESNDNKVTNNRIGTDRNGNAAVANGDGVVVITGIRNRVGPDNLISGNRDTGVTVKTAVNTNWISQNKVGVNAAGAGKVPNGKAGIYVFESMLTQVDHNCSSGNGQQGILILGKFDHTLGIAAVAMAGRNAVTDNVVGLSCDQSAKLGNTLDGVRVDASSQNDVSNNVIAGNDQEGVFVQDCDANTIGNNSIGQNGSGAAMGNGSTGVAIMRGSIRTNGNKIKSNRIGFNGGPGVLVQVDCIENTISENSIHDNGRPGIRLDGAGSPIAYGVTPFPPFSVAGGNISLAAPTLSTPTAGSPAIVQGKAGPNNIVELFVAKPDGSGAGQGDRFITSVAADAAGDFRLSSNLAANQVVTATATDSAGNTSQFSANATVQAPPPPKKTGPSLVSFGVLMSLIGLWAVRARLRARR